MAGAKFDINELAKGIRVSVKVTGMKVYKAKVKIGIVLIKLAVKIMGMNCQIGVEREKEI